MTKVEEYNDLIKRCQGICNMFATARSKGSKLVLTSKQEESLLKIIDRADTLFDELEKEGEVTTDKEGFITEFKKPVQTTLFACTT